MFIPTSRVLLVTPLVLAVMLGLCPAGAQAQTQATNAAAAADGIDQRVLPGVDFFTYANGLWMDTTDIPPGKVRWTARDDIDARARRQLQSLLDAVWAAPESSAARQVAAFRASLLDGRAIERRGMAPLKPWLDQISRVKDKPALARLLGSQMRADVDPINQGRYHSAHVLGLAAESSIHGEKDYVAFLVQGGLGLGERDHYLRTDPVSLARRQRYQEALAAALADLEPGRDRHIAARAAAVMDLETALAETHATLKDSDVERNADNVWTRADFERGAPGMDWPAFFKAAGLHKQRSIVVWQPGAIKGLAGLVQRMPVLVWQDYLRVRAIALNADALPAAFASLGPALRGEPDGAPGMTREQRATALTQSALREAIGHLYVERYFPAAQRARLNNIAAKVIAAFGKRVQNASWMSPSSKVMALAKLKVLYFGMVGPQQWPDEALPPFHASDPVGNLQRLARSDYLRTVGRLGRPINRARWAAAPHVVGGLLMFQQNAYNFSAALLQPPKFDPAASDAANYGAIGAIVGHEASHFVDILGRDYDADGRFTRWWLADDDARYAEASAALERQFSSYRPLAGLAVDGKRTASENAADLAGLAAAFDAHREALGELANPTDLRQQDRQFFLGFARSWRSKSSDAGLRIQLGSDAHAPDKYRVATVRNLDAWYEAFDVQPGQALYLDPTARVKIW